MTHNLPIQCIYASTSGNVEAVVERVASDLTQKGYQVELHRAEQTDINVITDNQFFVLATSTWEHGALNPFFSQLHQQMKEADFEGKSAAFVGLGDRRYEPVLFCEGMEKLKRTWLKNHGQELLQPLMIQGEPYAMLDLLVTPWVVKLDQALKVVIDQK